jgi:hypothetical protein
VQFDGEKPDKITRGACACNDDKVIFENSLNWTTRSFIFAKQREYENGPATQEPSGELSCEAATEENAKRPHDARKRRESESSKLLKVRARQARQLDNTLPA